MRRSRAAVDADRGPLVQASLSALVLRMPNAPHAKQKRTFVAASSGSCKTSVMPSAWPSGAPDFSASLLGDSEGRGSQIAPSEERRPVGEQRATRGIERESVEGRPLRVEEMEFETRALGGNELQPGGAVAWGLPPQALRSQR